MILMSLLHETLLERNDFIDEIGRNRLYYICFKLYMSITESFYKKKTFGFEDYNDGNVESFSTL